MRLSLPNARVTYKPLKPETVDFDAVQENDDIKFAYRYDVLYYRKNFKLAKSQDKLGVRIVAAQITNKTDRTLNITRDMDLLTQAGEYPYLMDTKTSVKKNSSDPQLRTCSMDCCFMQK